MSWDLSRYASGRFRRSRPSSTSGIEIGRTSGGAPVVFPSYVRGVANHSLVFGASGAGKSVLMAHALVSRIAEEASTEPNTRNSIVIIDPKSDLIDHVIAGIAARAPDRLGDITILDPFNVGFASNLCHHEKLPSQLEVRAGQYADIVGAVSTGTGTQRHLGIGARQRDVLVHLLLAALDSTDPLRTVLWAEDALMQKGGLKALATLTNSVRARQWLQARKSLSDELRASCASRLRTAFAATRTLERGMAADSCIDAEELMRPGRILLIDLGKPPAGLVSLQRFQSNLWSRLFLSTLFSRPSPWSGHQTMLVIDEAHIVAPLLADELEIAVTTMRSRGGAVCLMTQTVTLLRSASATLLPVLLGNTAIRFSGRLAASDAEALCRELGKAPGIDEPVARVRARIASELISLPDRRFFQFTPGGRRQFTSSNVDLAGWNAAAEAHAATITAIRTSGSGTLPEGTRPALAEVVALRTAPDPTSRRGSGRGNRPSRGPSTPWD